TRYARRPSANPRRTPASRSSASSAHAAVSIERRAARPVTGVDILRGARHELSVELRIGRRQRVGVTRDRPPQIVDLAVDEAALHARAVLDVDLVPAARRDAALRGVLPEDRVYIAAAGTGIVCAVPVSGERAAADRGPRARKHRHRAGAVLGMKLAAREDADIVDAHVRDVAGEEAVVERRPAVVEEVEAGPRDLRAVVTEDAIAEQHRLVRRHEVLDRDAGTARAGVVAAHLDVL